MKYIVIKTADIERHLWKDEKRQLADILEHIASEREGAGKTERQYFVVSDKDTELFALVKEAIVFRDHKAAVNEQN